MVSDTAWTIEDINAVCRQLGRNGKDCINMNYIIIVSNVNISKLQVQVQPIMITVLTYLSS